MTPRDRELDDEIRGHIAISVKERIERGEDPNAARRAALLEFGYIPQMRESMRRVWHSRWLDAIETFAHDIRVGVRSLRRAKGLAATVIVTLALGIGANAAIFSVVRGVLLRPLVNRGEDRLIYLRQSAPKITDNMTFSVPEIVDFRSRSTTVAAFGEFSTVDFTLVGLGEPRVVHAGVVNGTFFDVMGLRAERGRLLGPGDDGPSASPAAVLTHRFWSTTLASDQTVVGKVVRLGALNATIVGVLEPSVPYPADTEIIANIVSSPHHLGATMNKQRVHRMTELFGRLKPDASLESARADLVAAHDAMVREHLDAYPAGADVRLRVSGLRDEIASPARTVLLLLLAAAAVVFVIACSNVANLILARAVRREGELAVRAALGASRAALRRTLLAESLLLCGAGAILGVALARPFVTMVAGFAAQFSVRALEVSVDASVLWIGAGLAIAAAVLLAFVPRLPSSTAAHGFELTSSVRITPGTNRRLHAFAMTQIAFSFVLLAGTGALVAALISMQTAKTGYDLRQVLVFDLPLPRTAIANQQELDVLSNMTEQIARLPGVDRVALGSFVPWRDAGGLFGGGVPFTADGFALAKGEQDPRARLRTVTPGFFDLVGVPFVEGRDFTADDRANAELVVIVNQSLAQRMFADGHALNRRVWWTDPNLGPQVPRRIVGVVTDVDDVNIVSRPSPAIYHPISQFAILGRLFVRSTNDPHALVQPVTRVIRNASPNQVVERAATLDDVRAAQLAPERLNAFVFAGFAGVALLVAVVGVAGVLAFGVSARTREFGVRLAIGSTPRALLWRVLSEGARIVGVGLAAGVVGGYTCVAIAARYLDHLEVPGFLPILASAVVLVTAALAASLMPAARASRVDVLLALRSE